MQCAAAHGAEVAVKDGLIASLKAEINIKERMIQSTHKVRVMWF